MDECEQGECVKGLMKSDVQMVRLEGWHVDDDDEWRPRACGRASGQCRALA